MRSLWREPLLHFLVLGGLLFLLFDMRGGAGGSGSTRIVITAGQVEHLASGFGRTWNRAPTEAELKRLLDDYVKEEIAAREAAALGLDRDDTVIRRRLRQKLEFVAEEAAVPARPIDDEVRSWVEAHPGAFGQETRVSFRQVYLRAGEPGVKARAERLLVRLRASAGQAKDLGDPTLLPAEMPLGALSEVGRTFGDGFATAVAAAVPGEWTGPLTSSYGWHLVFVRERIAAAPSDLAAIRPMVERELQAERRARELQAFYDRMLAKYAVEIEMPQATQVAAAASPR